MEIEVHQQLYYSNKKIVPVKDIAESLIALENLIQQSQYILEAIFPGTRILSVEVFISKLHSDSIWEDLIVKFIFGDQARFDEVIKDLRKTFKMDYLISHPKLLSAVIASIILFGGVYCLQKNKNPEPRSQEILQINNNTIINVGAEYLKMDSKGFKTLIESNIRDKDQLAKSAMRIVNPAKKDSNATITFNGDENLRITSESVQAIPSHVIEEEEESVEEYNSIYMEVRATDLDSKKRGWAVVIPGFGDKRIKLQLDPDINAEQVLSKRRFFGNVTIVFKADKGKTPYPVLVFLRKITGEVDDQSISSLPYQNEGLELENYS